MAKQIKRVPLSNSARILPKGSKVLGAADKEQRIPAGKIANVLPQPKSLMPEQLLRDLTAQQAADLLEYLSSLK